MSHATSAASDHYTLAGGLVSHRFNLKSNRTCKPTTAVAGSPSSSSAQQRGPSDSRVSRIQFSGSHVLDVQKHDEFV